MSKHLTIVEHVHKPKHTGNCQEIPEHQVNHLACAVCSFNSPLIEAIRVCLSRIIGAGLLVGAGLLFGEAARLPIKTALFPT